jgi:hypothetical protein
MQIQYELCIFFVIWRSACLSTLRYVDLFSMT